MRQEMYLSALHIDLINVLSYVPIDMGLEVTNLRVIFSIFGKKHHGFNEIRIKFCSFLQLFKRNKLRKLGSNLKELIFLALSPPCLVIYMQDLLHISKSKFMLIKIDH